MLPFFLYLHNLRISWDWAGRICPYQILDFLPETLMLPSCISVWYWLVGYQITSKRSLPWLCGMGPPGDSLLWGRLTIACWLNRWVSLNHNAKIRNRWGGNSQLLILAHSCSYFFIDSLCSGVCKPFYMPCLVSLLNAWLVWFLRALWLDCGS